MIIRNIANSDKISPGSPGFSAEHLKEIRKKQRKARAKFPNFQTKRWLTAEVPTLLTRNVVSGAFDTGYMLRQPACHAQRRRHGYVSAAIGPEL